MVDVVDVVEVLDEVVEELVLPAGEVVVVEGLLDKAADPGADPQAAATTPATTRRLEPSRLRPDNIFMGASS